MKKIKHIICDLGGVILRTDNQKVFKSLGKYYVSSEDNVKISIKEFLDKSFFDVFMKGLKSKEDFYYDLCYECSLEMTFEQFVEVFNSVHLGMNKPFARLLQKLKASGYSLHLLSNIDEIHWEDAKKKCGSVLALFENLFLSYKMHDTKPNPAIFHRVIGRISTWPEECVFIDDSKDNIDVFRFIGGQAILYNEKKHKEFETKLKRILQLQ